MLRYLCLGFEHEELKNVVCDDELWELAKDLPVNPDNALRISTLECVRALLKKLDPSGMSTLEAREMFKEWKLNRERKK
jgi:hypothetical protein